MTECQPTTSSSCYYDVHAGLHNNCDEYHALIIYVEPSKVIPHQPREAPGLRHILSKVSACLSAEAVRSPIASGLISPTALSAYKGRIHLNTTAERSPQGAASNVAIIPLLVKYTIFHWHISNSLLYKMNNECIYTESHGRSTIAFCLFSILRVEFNELVMGNNHGDITFPCRFAIGARYINNAASPSHAADEKKHQAIHAFGKISTIFPLVCTGEFISISSSAVFQVEGMQL